MCNQPLRAVAQRFDHQTVVFQRRKTYPQRDVDVLAQRIDTPVGAFDVHLHFGVRRHETGNGLIDAHGRHRWRATDDHLALGFGFGTLNGFFGRVGLHQHRHAMAVIITTAFSHGKLAGRTVNQANAQALFQPGNAPTELGLGDPELAAGRRKASAFDHLDEIKQIVEIKHPATSFSEPRVCSAVASASRPGLRGLQVTQQSKTPAPPPKTLPRPRRWTGARRAVRSSAHPECARS